MTFSLSQFRINLRKTASNAAILTDVLLEAAPAGSRAAAVLSFRIEPPPLDPYAPSGDGDVRVIQGDNTERLAFLDQSIATVNDGPAVRAIAVEKPLWRAYVSDPGLAAAFQIQERRTDLEGQESNRQAAS